MLRYEYVIQWGKKTELNNTAISWRTVGAAWQDDSRQPCPRCLDLTRERRLASHISQDSCRACSTIGERNCARRGHMTSRITAYDLASRSADSSRVFSCILVDLVSRGRMEEGCDLTTLYGAINRCSMNSRLWLGGEGGKGCHRCCQRRRRSVNNTRRMWQRR